MSLTLSSDGIHEGAPSSVTSHASKQEVYLYTFRLAACERPEDEVVALAAMNAFKHAWVELLVMKDFVGLQRLFRTLEDVIDAMNEHSEDYIFMFHEVDRTDLMASFVEFPLILMANFVKHGLFPQFESVFHEEDHKGLEMLVKLSKRGSTFPFRDMPRYEILTAPTASSP